MRTHAHWIAELRHQAGLIATLIASDAYPICKTIKSHARNVLACPTDSVRRVNWACYVLDEERLMYSLGLLPKVWK